MKKVIASVIAAVGLTFLCSFGSLAAEVFQTVSTPSEGCSLVAVEGAYNTDSQAVLDRINEIRYEACQEGVQDPRNPSSALTPDDYVPLEWSSSLEYVARVRAAEASIYNDHTRPNNTAWFTVTAPDGKSSFSENLAWNWSSTMVSGVNKWYQEKTSWITQDTSKVTGHYTSMINPDYRYVGLASFTNPNAKYPNTVSGEFDGYYKHDTSMGAAVPDVRVIIEVQTSALLDAALKVRSEKHQQDGKLDKNDTIDYALTLKVKLGGFTSSVYDVGEIVWTSSDQDVAAVDADGKVQITGVGEATIKAESGSWSASAVLKPAHTPELLAAVEPTCTETGLTEGKKCSVCGEILEAQKEIPAKGHTEETLAAKDPTCTETGLTEGKKCSVCGKILEAQKEIPALGHDFSEWKEATAPTCTEEGSKERICSRCNEKETASVPAKGHTMETLKAKDPTCTETGLTEGKKCSVCGETLAAQEEIPALGHAFGEWNEVTAPTCTKEGSKERTCSRCKEKEMASVPANGHTEETLKAKNPTCTETGLTEGKKCSVCGETVTAQEEIPALGHDFSEWKEVTAPTCTEEGSKERICSRCDEKETETIQATGHKDEVIPGKVATCVDTGLTEGKKCSVCGETLAAQREIPATGIHSWDAGKVTTAPTVESKGVRTYTCTVCGETRTETIDKLIVASDPVLGTVDTMEEKVEALSENGDPAGSSFRILQVKSKKVSKSAITIAWKPVPNASGYIIFGAPCGSRYGKLTDVRGASFTQSGLKKGTYYKYLVSAYDKYGNILASSKTVHIATAGGKKGNTKAVRLNKKKVTLKKGKSFKLKATLKNGKLKVKKHRKVAFESDNPNVARVSGNGKIKAVGKGTCTIYAYAQNGVFAKCKVTVR